ncbi:hypothetical protein DYB26_013378, partial [Aphanomyces astaci]
MQHEPKQPGEATSEGLTDPPPSHQDADDKVRLKDGKDMYRRVNTPSTAPPASSSSERLAVVTSSSAP